MRVLNANYQALLISIGKDQMTKSSENIVHCLKIWRYLDTFNSDALKLVANKSDFALHHIIVSCFVCEFIHFASKHHCPPNPSHLFWCFCGLVKSFNVIEGKGRWSIGQSRDEAFLILFLGPPGPLVAALYVCHTHRSDTQKHLIKYFYTTTTH